MVIITSRGSIVKCGVPVKLPNTYHSKVIMVGILKGRGGKLQPTKIFHHFSQINKLWSKNSKCWLLGNENVWKIFWNSMLNSRRHKMHSQFLKRIQSFQLFLYRVNKTSIIKHVNLYVFSKIWKPKRFNKYNKYHFVFYLHKLNQVFFSTGSGELKIDKAQEGQFWTTY